MTMLNTRTRITIPLKLEEKAALSKLAEQERRDPGQQAAVIIRTVLENAGYLQPIKTLVNQEADYQADVPVDTGALKNSIGVSVE